MAEEKATKYSKEATYDQIEAVVVANADGYGSGILGPWYEWYNKSVYNEFWADDGADKSGEAARAFQYWELIRKQLSSGNGKEIISWNNTTFRGGLHMGSKNVPSFEEGVINNRRTSKTPSAPYNTDADLFNNVKYFFANFILCQVVKGPLIWVRRPLGAISPAYPQATNAHLTGTVDIEPRQVGVNNSGKPTTVNLLKPKKNLNREYVEGQTIRVAMLHRPWFFGDQFIPAVIAPITNEVFHNPEYLNKQDTIDSGYGYLPDFFMTQYLKKALVNKRLGLPHGPSNETLSQTAQYPQQETNWLAGGTGKVLVGGGEYTPVEGHQFTHYRFATVYVDMNRDGRFHIDSSVTTTTAAPTTTTTPEPKCYKCWEKWPRRPVSSPYLHGYVYATSLSEARVNCASTVNKWVNDVTGPFELSHCTTTTGTSTTTTSTSTTTTAVPKYYMLFDGRECPSGNIVPAVQWLAEGAVVEGSAYYLPTSPYESNSGSVVQSAFGKGSALASTVVSNPFWQEYPTDTRQPPSPAPINIFGGPTVMNPTSAKQLDPNFNILALTNGRCLDDWWPVDGKVLAMPPSDPRMPRTLGGYAYCDFGSDSCKSRNTTTSLNPTSNNYRGYDCDIPDLFYDFSGTSWSGTAGQHTVWKLNNDKCVYCPSGDWSNCTTGSATHSKVAVFKDCTDCRSGTTTPPPVTTSTTLTTPSPSTTTTCNPYDEFCIQVTLDESDCGWGDYSGIYDPRTWSHSCNNRTGFCRWVWEKRDDPGKVVFLAGNLGRSAYIGTNMTRIGCPQVIAEKIGANSGNCPDPDNVVGTYTATVQWASGASNYVCTGCNFTVTKVPCGTTTTASPGSSCEDKCIILQGTGTNLDSDPNDDSTWYRPEKLGNQCGSWVRDTGTDISPNPCAQGVAYIWWGGMNNNWHISCDSKTSTAQPNWQSATQSPCVCPWDATWPDGIVLQPEDCPGRPPSSDLLLGYDCEMCVDPTIFEPGAFTKAEIAGLHPYFDQDDTCNDAGAIKVKRFSDGAEKCIGWYSDAPAGSVATHYAIELFDAPTGGCEVCQGTDEVLMVFEGNTCEDRGDDWISPSQPIYFTGSNYDASVQNGDGTVSNYFHSSGFPPTWNYVSATAAYVEKDGTYVCVENVSHFADYKNASELTAANITVYQGRGFPPNCNLSIQSVCPTFNADGTVNIAGCCEDTATTVAPPPPTLGCKDCYEITGTFSSPDHDGKYIQSGSSSELYFGPGNISMMWDRTESSCPSGQKRWELTFDGGNTAHHYTKCYPVDKNGGPSVCPDEADWSAGPPIASITDCSPITDCVIPAGRDLYHAGLYTGWVDGDIAQCSGDSCICITCDNSCWRVVNASSLNDQWNPNSEYGKLVNTSSAWEPCVCPNTNNATTTSTCKPEYQCVRCHVDGYSVSTSYSDKTQCDNDCVDDLTYTVISNCYNSAGSPPDCIQALAMQIACPTTPKPTPTTLDPTIDDDGCYDCIASTSDDSIYDECVRPFTGSSFNSEAWIANVYTKNGQQHAKNLCEEWWKSRWQDNHKPCGKAEHVSLPGMEFKTGGSVHINAVPNSLFASTCIPIALPSETIATNAACPEETPSDWAGDIDKRYLEGTDWVCHESNTYVCKKDHDAEEDLEPGTTDGNNYWTVRADCVNLCTTTTTTTTTSTTLAPITNNCPRCITVSGSQSSWNKNLDGTYEAQGAGSDVGGLPTWVSTHTGHNGATFTISWEGGDLGWTIRPSSDEGVGASTNGMLRSYETGSSMWLDCPVGSAEGSTIFYRKVAGQTPTDEPANGLLITGLDEPCAKAKIYFASAASSVAEGNSGTSTHNVTVTRDTITTSAVTVNYATSDGTASAGSDYTSTSGTLSFGSGETSKNISITITGDGTEESNETFTVTLTSPSAGAELGSQTTHTVTITNDDLSPVACNTGGGGDCDSVDEWQNSETYSVDAVVCHTNILYKCIQDVTVAGTYEPSVDSGWESYWELGHADDCISEGP